MARQGKGDPRWLVVEREDGRNVDYWHWDSKDCTPQAHERIRSIFNQVKLISDGSNQSNNDSNSKSKMRLGLGLEHMCECEIEHVISLDGHIQEIIRKGKRSFWFDNVTIILCWNATIGGEHEFRGRLEIRKLKTEKSPEIIAKRMRIIITSVSSSEHQESLVAALQSDGVANLCDLLNEGFPVVHLPRIRTNPSESSSPIGTPTRSTTPDNDLSTSSSSSISTSSTSLSTPLETANITTSQSPITTTTPTTTNSNRAALRRARKQQQSDDTFKWLALSGAIVAASAILGFAYVKTHSQ